ncbi:MAG: RibD family protein, partial [Comamonadaceae bacterium]
GLGRRRGRGRGRAAGARRQRRCAGPAGGGRPRPGRRRDAVGVAAAVRTRTGRHRRCRGPGALALAARAHRLRRQRAHRGRAGLARTGPCRGASHTGAGAGALVAGRRFRSRAVAGPTGRPVDAGARRRTAGRGRGGARLFRKRWCAGAGRRRRQPLLHATLVNIAAPTPVDAVWQACLAIAWRPAGGALPPGVRWGTASGHALDAEAAPEAQAVFDLFKPLLDRCADPTGWTVGQLGQSLDGCIATHTGDSCFVNGPEGLVHVHRLRALCDAVIVGAGTAALDDPQLTTRRVPGPNAVRVVLDPSLRVPATARIFQDDQAPTLVVCGDERRAEAEARFGAERVVAVARHGHAPLLPLADVVRALNARGLRRLFVEGGGVTVSAFVQQRCLDRLHLIVAPVVIGGRSASPIAAAVAHLRAGRPKLRARIRHRRGAQVHVPQDIVAEREGARRRAQRIAHRGRRLHR